MFPGQYFHPEASSRCPGPMWTGIFTTSAAPPGGTGGATGRGGVHLRDQERFQTPGSQETDPTKDEIVSSHSPKSAKEVFLTAVEHLARVVPGGAPQPNFFLGP